MIRSWLELLPNISIRICSEEIAQLNLLTPHLTPNSKRSPISSPKSFSLNLFLHLERKKAESRSWSHFDWDDFSLGTGQHRDALPSPGNIIKNHFSFSHRKVLRTFLKFIREHRKCRLDAIDDPWNAQQFFEIASGAQLSGYNDRACTLQNRWRKPVKCIDWKREQGNVNWSNCQTFRVLGFWNEETSSSRPAILVFNFDYTLSGIISLSLASSTSSSCASWKLFVISHKNSFRFSPATVASPLVRRTESVTSPKCATWAFLAIFKSDT